MARSAVVLLSGGLDSATVLAIAKTEGFAVHALSVRCGQRHAIEIARAGALARAPDAAPATGWSMSIRGRSRLRR
jgi:7-cyano-7-deazaguanine synthase